MAQIKVVVHGAAGRVGQEVVKAVCQEPDMQLVGAVDVKVTGDTLGAAGRQRHVPFSTDFKSIIDYLPAGCRGGFFHR